MSERPRIKVRFPQIEFAIGTVKDLINFMKRERKMISGQEGLADAVKTIPRSIDPEIIKRESIIGIYATGKETDPTKIARQLAQQGFDQVEINSMLIDIEAKRQAKEKPDSS